MKRKKIYLIASGNAIKDSIVANDSKCELEILDFYYFRTKIVRTFFYLWSRRKAALLRKMISSEIWKKYYFLNGQYSDDEQIFILAPGNKINTNVLEKEIAKYKANHSAKFVLLLFDSIENIDDVEKDKLKDIFETFDLVMSFEQEEAKEYGIAHFDLPYDKRQMEKNNEHKADLFFVGYNKNRLKILNKIFEKASKRGLACDFNVYDKGIKALKISNGIPIRSGYMKYEKVLEKIAGSNCILEVLCNGQKSSTLRYYEAVAYNKKLISNNRNIEKLPFYNPEYMQAFSDVDQIDFDWIKEKENVDYGYNDEFCWDKLICRIVSELSNGNK